MGKVIYEQTESAIILARVSPDGRFVALLEAGAGMAWITIIDRSGTLQSRSKRRATSVLLALIRS